ncbi:MAG: CBS domain-containing protein [Thaumarchaeota archaeon]|nr:CBS domain-containing protein [Nitrososphaerota archaeon]
MVRGFLSDLHDLIYDKIKNHNKKESILFSPSTLGKDLNHCTIEEILPHLLICSSMATIESKEKVWVATSMLVRFLATHTNNLVVMENDTPVGMVGSREVLQGLYSNPNHAFFSEQAVNNIMNRDLEMVSAKMRVYDLLKRMNDIRRDFALVQTTDGEFSTISARRLLEVGILCDTRIKVADIPSKKVVTFQKEDSIGFLIGEMLRNNTDVVILEKTPLFVTPQMIFEKISELNYLEDVDDFLDSKASILNLKNGRIISDNITVPEMCKIMLGMKNAFVMTQNNVLTPWDVITTLA